MYIKTCLGQEDFKQKMDNFLEQEDYKYSFKEHVEGFFYNSSKNILKGVAQYRIEGSLFNKSDYSLVSLRVLFRLHKSFYIFLNILLVFFFISSFLNFHISYQFVNNFILGYTIIITLIQIIMMNTIVKKQCQRLIEYLKSNLEYEVLEVKEFNKLLEGVE